MNTPLKIKACATGLLAGVCGLLVAAGCAAAESPGEVVVAKQQLKFEHLNPAIQMATAYGDRSKTAHGTFGKFPAKFVTPFHTHSGAYHGVVLRGVMTNPFKGKANPPEMTAGSYWHVPANSVHATACVSDTPCEFYFHSKSGFDFHPAE